MRNAATTPAEKAGRAMTNSSRALKNSIPWESLELRLWFPLILQIQRRTRGCGPRCLYRSPFQVSYGRMQVMDEIGGQQVFNVWKGKA